MRRLRWHQDDHIAFFDQAGAPFDNNHAERAIRPAVILRINSYGNRSGRGTDCQAVPTSVFRALKQCGLYPIQTVVEAIEHHLQHKQLHPLHPPNNATDG